MKQIFRINRPNMTLNKRCWMGLFIFYGSDIIWFKSSIPRVLIWHRPDMDFCFVVLLNSTFFFFFFISNAFTFYFILPASHHIITQSTAVIFHFTGLFKGIFIGDFFPLAAETRNRFPLTWNLNQQIHFSSVSPSNNSSRVSKYSSRCQV